MGWLKLYDEFAWDPKVQAMSESLQRRWVMILCLRNIDDTSTTTDREVSLALRITLREAQETRKEFASRGFLVGDTWGIKHWAARQNDESDSARRMRKLRAKRHNVTSPCDAQSDGREIERKKDRQNPPLYPPPTGKIADSIFLLPEWIDPPDWADYEAMRNRMKKPMTPRARQLAIKTLEALRAAGHDPGRVLQQSIMNSWQGLFPIKTERANPPNGEYRPERQTPEEFERYQAVRAATRARAEEVRREYEERKRANETT